MIETKVKIDAKKDKYKDTYKARNKDKSKDKNKDKNKDINKNKIKMRASRWMMVIVMIRGYTYKNIIKDEDQNEKS